ncbi:MULTISPECIES: T9SS type A sorting domain-containing protein [unclassified Polaribacter]|uniref:T9SS type A sorting domain-containing protein n=1 Tax=unclassified Polaribacter TaxID=196858 RepID=UPI001CB9CE9F|nr:MULTISPECIES: T9SS type A sorting domain-containing protein [unclassified Polaribacter]
MKKIDKVLFYNTLGQLVINKTKATKQLITRNLNSGLYFIKIYSGNKTITKKIAVTQ